MGKWWGHVGNRRFSHTCWKQTHELHKVYKCTYTHIYTLMTHHIYTLTESYLIPNSNRASLGRHCRLLSLEGGRQRWKTLIADV